MIHFPILAITCLLAIPAITITHAQEEQRTGGRQVWFAASSIPDGLDNPMRVLIGEKIQEVTLSTRMASEPVRISADGLVRIVREIPDPANASETIFQDVARAAVPEGVREALIMLIPRAEPTPAGIIFHTVVQDLAQFGGGDYMFLNLTQLPVAVQLGDKRVPLRPGQTTITKPDALREPRQASISYHFQEPDEGEWRLISASTVVLMPTRREICVFSWDERYDRINYRGITFPVTN